MVVNTNISMYQTVFANLNVVADESSRLNYCSFANFGFGAYRNFAFFKRTETLTNET